MDDIEDIMRMDKEKLAAPIKTIEVQCFFSYDILGKTYLHLFFGTSADILKNRVSDMVCFVLFCLRC